MEFKPKLYTRYHFQLCSLLIVICPGKTGNYDYFLVKGLSFVRWLEPTVEDPGFKIEVAFSFKFRSQCKRVAVAAKLPIEMVRGSKITRRANLPIYQRERNLSRRKIEESRGYFAALHGEARLIAVWCFFIGDTCLLLHGKTRFFSLMLFST